MVGIKKQNKNFKKIQKNTKKKEKDIATSNCLLETLWNTAVIFPQFKCERDLSYWQIFLVTYEMERITGNNCEDHYL